LNDGINLTEAEKISVWHDSSIKLPKVSLQTKRTIKTITLSVIEMTDSDDINKIKGVQLSVFDVAALVLRKPIKLFRDNCDWHLLFRPPLRLQLPPTHLPLRPGTVEGRG
jgi:hypothetical protein